MNLPEKIKTGDKRNVIYSRFNALLDFVRGLEIKGDNRTIFLSKTPSGILIRGKNQSSGRSVGASADSAYAYMGYFKLYLITETSGGTTTYKVRIADGATYLDEDNPGGSSTCKVNNTTFAVASYLSGALAANTLFYLKYDHSAGTVTIEASATLTLPSDTDTTAYYQLGRFYKRTSPPVTFITQDHSTVGSVLSLYAIPIVVANGIPQIWWMKNEC